jgi:peptidyl-prolyl cis-trans isomerase A (cyclophilin A)
MSKPGWIMVAAIALLTPMPWGIARAQTLVPSQHRQATAGQAPHHAAQNAYDHALLRPALLSAKAPAEYKVKFATTRGDFVVTVTRSWAPLGADRFYNLVRHHFYDNASFFRVVPGFVAQFGLSAYPQVSAAWARADLKDDPVTQNNKRGYLTFATAGPNTRTTQIFINLRDNSSSLDSQGFAPFGTVDSEGMKVVDMLYDQYSNGDNDGPDQDKITRLGKPYLDKAWPKLDSIKTATLLPAEPAATAKKPE